MRNSRAWAGQAGLGPPTLCRAKLQADTVHMLACEVPGTVAAPFCFFFAERGGVPRKWNESDLIKIKETPSEMGDGTLDTGPGGNHIPRSIKCVRQRARVFSLAASLFHTLATNRARLSSLATGQGRNVRFSDSTTASQVRIGGRAASFLGLWTRVA